MCSRQTSISEEAEEAEDGDEAGEEAEAVMAEALASIKLVNFLNIGGGGVAWKCVLEGRAFLGTFGTIRLLENQKNHFHFVTWYSLR